MSVGFLGLGRMGGPMASRLVGQVNKLLVHDVSAEAVDALAAQGAEAAGSAKALGDRCEIVFLSLPPPAIVREAVLGGDGVAAGGKVKLICDLSTSGPGLAQELAAALLERNIASLDAPVSG